MSQRHLSAQSSIREIRKPEISHPQLIVLLQPPPHDARPRMREKNLRPRCTTLVPIFPAPPMPPPPSSFLSSILFLFVPFSPFRPPIKTGAPAAQNRLLRPKRRPTAGNPPTCLSEGGGRRRRGKEGDYKIYIHLKLASEIKRERNPLNTCNDYNAVEANERARERELERRVKQHK